MKASDEEYTMESEFSDISDLDDHQCKPNDESRGQHKPSYKANTSQKNAPGGDEGQKKGHWLAVSDCSEGRIEEGGMS